MAELLSLFAPYIVINKDGVKYIPNFPRLPKLRMTISKLLNLMILPFINKIVASNYKLDILITMEGDGLNRISSHKKSLNYSDNLDKRPSDSYNDDYNKRSNSIIISSITISPSSKLNMEPMTITTSNESIHIQNIDSSITSNWEISNNDDVISQVLDVKIIISMVTTIVLKFMTKDIVTLPSVETSFLNSEIKSKDTKVFLGGSRGQSIVYKLWDEKSDYDFFILGDAKFSNNVELIEKNRNNVTYRKLIIHNSSIKSGSSYPNLTYFNYNTYQDYIKAVDLSIYHTLSNNQEIVTTAINMITELLDIYALIGDYTENIGFLIKKVCTKKENNYLLMGV